MSIGRTRRGNGSVSGDFNVPGVAAATRLDAHTHRAPLLQPDSMPTHLIARLPHVQMHDCQHAWNLSMGLRVPARRKIWRTNADVVLLFRDQFQLPSALRALRTFLIFETLCDGSVTLEKEIYILTLGPVSRQRLFINSAARYGEGDTFEIQ